MKQILLLTIFFLSWNLLNAQDLIGTPGSLILVYNYPENYFYLQLKGEDKRETGNENVFLIDNMLVQVKTLHKAKFIKNMKPGLSSVDFINSYIHWEKSYIEETFSFNTNSKVDFLRTQKGREIAFWTYDMPFQKQKQATDSTRTVSTQKQLFVLTRIKDYILAINSPLFETDKFDTIKTYLITNIDGIVESKQKIDVDDLNKKLNK